MKNKTNPWQKAGCLKMKKKKIIFVHLALWIGGIETALVNMLNRMDYEKYDVTCLITSDYQEMAGHITPKCRLLIADRGHCVSFQQKYPYDRVFRLMEKPGSETPLRMLRYRAAQSLRGWENARYIDYIRGLLQEEHFDTAIAFSGKVNELTVRAIRADRYLSFYHYSDLRRVYHDEIGYKKSARIFAVSDRLTQRLREYLPAHRDKIEPLPNLTDVDSIRRRSSEACPLAFPEDRFHIVSCGRLVGDKGFDLAIQACAQLVGKGHTSILWTIVGEGPERSQLQALVKELGMEEHVRFAGQQSNPYAIMKAGDMFVQSSRIEAFGLTIIEAMIVGTPVISTRTDGGLELLGDEQFGLLCDAAVPSIADAVEKMLRDPQLRQQFAARLAQRDFDSMNRAIMQRLYEVL